MDWHLVFNAIGMLSFMCSACAYLMTSLLRLRALAILSGALGLIYNSTLPSGPLWLVLFWLALFMCINVARLIAATIGEMEVTLPPGERALMVATFPSMHSRDWVELRKLARIEHHKLGEVLLTIGGSTDAVNILAAGFATEIRADGTRINRSSSTMWGELSYVTCQQFDGSPCEIVTNSDVSVMVLPYVALRVAASKNARLRAALMEGFVRTAGLKHGLLLNTGAVSDGNEVEQSVDQHLRTIDRWRASPASAA